MNLITLTQPQSATAEAYRTLRTNLHFATLDAPAKTLLIASPDPDDAPARVLANLAVTMAQVGRRVIAVDANLRQPTLHALFDLPNATGLSDWLSSAHDDLGASALQPTSVPGLHVLSAGATPPVPIDLISSARMATAITRLSTLADAVLFNAPPVGEFSDAALLASQLDGALIVFTAGKTRRDQARQAKDILARAHARVIGAVMIGTQ